MGFLKFLKRDKSNEPNLEGIEDLDVPPLPPGMEDKELSVGGKELEELPELPEIPDIEGDISLDKPPSPELKPLTEKPLPELELPEEKLDPEELPPSPELPKLDEGIEKPEPPKPGPLFGSRPRPLFGAQLQKETPNIRLPPEPIPKIKPYERLERAAVREQKGVLQHKEAKGPIFVRVERFRDILTGTNTIKNNLKIASQSIAKLNELDANRDKVLEKWHNVMMDLQKKLIFIDKTLFKR